MVLGVEWAKDFLLSLLRMDMESYIVFEEERLGGSWCVEALVFA